MELGWPLDWALFYYNTLWCCCFILKLIFLLGVMSHVFVP